MTHTTKITAGPQGARCCCDLLLEPQLILLTAPSARIHAGHVQKCPEVHTQTHTEAHTSKQPTHLPTHPRHSIAPATVSPLSTNQPEELAASRRDRKAACAPWVVGAFTEAACQCLTSQFSRAAGPPCSQESKVGWG